MAETLADRVLARTRAGVPMDEIASDFKAKYGMELREFKPSDTFEHVQQVAQSRRPKPAAPTPAPAPSVDLPGDVPPPANAPDAEHPVELAKRAARWAGGVVTGLPALAVGAIGDLAMATGPVALAHPELGEQANQRIIDRAKAAADANRQVRQDRAQKPGWKGALQDLGDVVAGAGRLVVGQGLNMEGPRNESPIDTAKRRYAQGEELQGGMIGATADIARGLTDMDASNPLLTQPVSTAATLLPAARALRAGAAAGAQSAVARGGMVGKVGQAVATAADATNYPARALKGVGESVLQRLKVYPGAEELAGRLIDEVRAGRLSAEEAGKLMDSATPWQSVAVMHGLSPQVGAVAGAVADVAKGAAIGGLLGSGADLGLAGAALGGAAPLARRALQHLAPNATGRAAAAYRRNVSDPAAQPTEAATEVVRNMTEPPAAAAAELRDLSAEAAGQMRRGQVQLQMPQTADDARALSSPVPATTAKTLVVSPEGKLVLPPPEVERRFAVGEQAQGTARWMDLAKEAMDTIAELKTRPDTANPSYIAANARYQKLAKEYRWLSENIPGVPDAMMRRALSDVFPDMAAAFDARKAFSAADTLRTQIAKGAQDLRTMKGGAMPLPEDPALASHSAAVLDADLAVQAAQRKHQAMVDKVAAYNARWSPKGQTAAPPPAPGRAYKNTHLLPKRAQAQALMQAQLADTAAGLDRAKAARVNLDKTAPAPAQQPAAKTANWSGGLDEAAGLQRTGDSNIQLATTTNPVFEKLIDRAHQTMTQAGQQVPRHWFARAFTDVLHDKGQGLLFAPQMRGLVIKEILDQSGLAGKAAKTLRRQLDDAFVRMNADTFGTNPQTLTLEIGGARKSLNDFVTDAITKAPKLMQEIRADAMEHIGKQLAIQAEDTHLSAAVNSEIHRFVAPAVDAAASPNPRGVKDIAGYAANVADRVLTNGEAPPQIAPFDPARMAQMLRASVERGKIPRGLDGSKVLALAEDLERNYEPAPQAVQDYLHSQRALGTMPATPGDGVWVAKGAGATLNARVKLLQAAKQTSLLDKMLAQAKLAMTAYRVKTQFNNIGSNLMHQFIRRGELPIAVMGEALKDTLALREHLRGGASPEAQMWRGISRSGIGNLANLEGEVGALQAMSSPHGLLQAKLHHIEQIARRGYNMGDMPFKVNEAARAYRQAMKDLAEHKPGEKVRVRVGSDRAVELTRTADGWEGMGRKFLDGSDQLADLVAKGAVDSAQRNFINTAHSPLWLQRMRASRWGTLASPFLSWSFGAMELPGKPGLLRNMMGFDGSYIVETNNPTILGRNAARAMEVATRRAAILGATRAQLDPNRDETREALTRIPGDTPAIDVQPSHNDPWLVQTKDYSSMNPYSRAGIVFRIGHAGLGLLFGPDKVPSLPELEKMDPEAAKRVATWQQIQGKQVATASDVMDVLGLSGNPILDLAKELNESADPRGNVDTGAVLARFAASMIGGSPMDALRVGIGAADPLHAVAGRPFQWGGSKPGPMDLGTFAVDALTGMAYKDQQLVGDKGKTRLFLDNMHTALNTSLTRSHKQRLQKLGRMLISKPDDADLQQQMRKEVEAYATAKAFVERAYGLKKAAQITTALTNMRNATEEQKANARKQMEVPPEPTEGALPVDTFEPPQPSP